LETDEKSALVDKLDRLSQMTWSDIQNAHHKGMGMERIPKGEICAGIPARMDHVEKFHVFRFHGNCRMVGHRNGHTLHVIWFDRNYSLYDHGE
jgi:hypothetical protein